MSRKIGETWVQTRDDGTKWKVTQRTANTQHYEPLNDITQMDEVYDIDDVARDAEGGWHQADFRPFVPPPAPPKAPRVTGTKTGLKHIDIKPKGRVTEIVITEFRDVNNNLIQVGQVVAFNHSGAVRVGKVCRIGKVKLTGRRAEYEFEHNIPSSRINVDVEHLNGGVSSISNRESIHILTKDFVNQF